jgi:hypothetical protein
MAANRKISLFVGHFKTSNHIKSHLDPLRGSRGRFRRRGTLKNTSCVHTGFTVGQNHMGNVNELPSCIVTLYKA